MQAGQDRSQPAAIDAAVIRDLIHRLAKCGDLPPILASSEVSERTKIQELGLDSLAMITLLEEISQLADLVLPDDAFDASETIGRLAIRINAMQSTGAQANA